MQIFPLTVVMSFVAPMLGVANAAIFGFSKKVSARGRRPDPFEQTSAPWLTSEARHVLSLDCTNDVQCAHVRQVRAAYREKCCNHQRKASYRVNAPPPSPGDKPRTVVTPEQKKAATKDDTAPDGAAELTEVPP